MVSKWKSSINLPTFIDMNYFLTLTLNLFELIFPFFLIFQTTPLTKSCNVRLSPVQIDPTGQFVLFSGQRIPFPPQESRFGHLGEKLLKLQENQTHVDLVIDSYIFNLIADY